MTAKAEAAYRKDLTVKVRGALKNTYESDFTVEEIEDLYEVLKPVHDRVSRRASNDAPVEANAGPSL